MGNFTAKDRLAQRSSSSSGELPYYLGGPLSSSKSAEERAASWESDFPGPSSSDSHAPNTTTDLKSSSTAPDETKPPKKTKEDLPRKRKERPPTDETPKGYGSMPKWNKPYTAPEHIQPDMDGIRDAIETGLDESASAQPDTPLPQLEPHRSVLSAIMGWDDIPYGQKWTHYLQHGFTGMHGDAFNELMQLAGSERRAAANGSSASYSAEMRSRDKEAGRILNQWNALMKQWETGRYAGADETLTKAFYERAEKLRNAYGRLGFSVDELVPPSMNAGGFAQGFQKSIQEDRGKLDHLGELLNDIQVNIANNPEWLDGPDANTRFDKLSEYVLLMMAESKGAIADAEKVRAQIENMSSADKAVYDAFMRRFFNVNTILQVEALANAGDRDAQAFLNNYESFQRLGETDQKSGVFAEVNADGSFGMSTQVKSISDKLMVGINKLRDKIDFNPIDLATALNSYKAGKDAFLDVIMQQGNTNKESVWNQAVDLHENVKAKYNRKLPLLGLHYGWDYKGPKIDKGLANYLKEYQDWKGADPVLASATLASPHPPKPNRDPTGNRGGAGGLTTTDPTSSGDRRWLPGMNKYAIRVNGKWVVE